MHIHTATKSFYGQRYLAAPSLVRVNLTRHELQLLIGALKASAEALEREGNDNAAKSLEWRCASLREAGR